MVFRKATEKDLPSIIQMLATDKLGKSREEFGILLSDSYIKAFDRINNDEAHELIVAEHSNGDIIGTLQLTFIPYLTYKGGMRAQIEAVRVHDEYTGFGIGTEMINWAIQRSKDRGAHVVQLTSDKQRPDAIRFYEKLGFKASHEGMKLHL